MSRVSMDGKLGSKAKRLLPRKLSASKTITICIGFMQVQFLLFFYYYYEIPGRAMHGTRQTRS